MSRPSDDQLLREDSSSDVNGDAATSTLGFADLVGAMATAESSDDNDGNDDDDESNGLQLPLQLQQFSSSLNGEDVTAAQDSTVSFVVALFCDGFVCRHWTRKSGWVEGFAQSYDATSRYFLDCLEKERLPDGLLELIDVATPSNELRTEIWDLRAHATALCPLTSADLPRTAPMPSEISGATVRQVVLKPRNQVVLTELNKYDCDPASDPFPQLSNADLDALTYDELASLALGTDSELLGVDESLALLSVDEVVGLAVDESSEQGAAAVPTTVEAIDSLLDNIQSAEDVRTVSTTGKRGITDLFVNNGIDHCPSLDTLDITDLITPKRTGIDDLPPWEFSLTSSPRAFLSPNESKARRPQLHHHRLSGQAGSLDPSVDANPFANWPDSPSSDDDWVVKNGVLRSITPIDADLGLVKSEHSTPTPLPRRPAKQAKTKRAAKPTSPVRGDGVSLDGMPPASLHLSLTQDACNWLDAVDSKSTLKKKKKKYRCLKPSIDGATPLPATHLFLSRLKGKRPRNYTIDELDHGSPAWMMMKHMTRFYQEALSFERRHAHFLQVNVERIMTAERKATEPSKIAAGSMDYVARQLHHFTRPDQVIAAANEAKRLASPLAAEIKRWRPSISPLIDLEGDNDDRDDKRSGLRSPCTALRPGAEQFLSADVQNDGVRSPTSSLAAMTITSPPSSHRRVKKRAAVSPLARPQSHGHPALPSRPSVRSPPAPLGRSARTSNTFMDTLDGEVFEC